jgi:hypothetical protein
VGGWFIWGRWGAAGGLDTNTVNTVKQNTVANTVTDLGRHHVQVDVLEHAHNVNEQAGAVLGVDGQQGAGAVVGLHDVDRGLDDGAPAHVRRVIAVAPVDAALVSAAGSDVELTTLLLRAPCGAARRSGRVLGVQAVARPRGCVRAMRHRQACAPGSWGRLTGNVSCSDASTVWRISSRRADLTIFSLVTASVT